MKYVLIRPDEKADVLFFRGIQDIDTFTELTALPKTVSTQGTVTTEFLSKAHVFDYTEEQMQYVLDKVLCINNYSAVPIQDIDIFKAKLAGV